MEQIEVYGEMMKKFAETWTSMWPNKSGWIKDSLNYFDDNPLNNEERLSRIYPKTLLTFLSQSLNSVPELSKTLFSKIL